MGFANFNYWMHCSLFCISIIQSTFCFLLREANWSDHRPRFKATVNFNGKELLAASSVRVVKVYLNFYFLCIFKIFRVNSFMFSFLGIEFMVCNFLYF